MRERTPKWITENMYGFKHLLALLLEINIDAVTEKVCEYLFGFADEFAVIMGHNGYIRIEFKNDTHKGYVHYRRINATEYKLGYDMKHRDQFYDYQVKKVLAE